jgi:hypothetical protein
MKTPGKPSYTWVIPLLIFSVSGLSLWFLKEKGFEDIWQQEWFLFLLEWHTQQKLWLWFLGGSILIYVVGKKFFIRTEPGEPAIEMFVISMILGVIAGLAAIILGYSGEELGLSMVLSGWVFIVGIISVISMKEYLFKCPDDPNSKMAIPMVFLGAMLASMGVLIDAALLGILQLILGLFIFVKGTTFLVGRNNFAKILGEQSFGWAILAMSSGMLLALVGKQSFYLGMLWTVGTLIFAGGLLQVGTNFFLSRRNPSLRSEQVISNSKNLDNRPVTNSHVNTACPECGYPVSKSITRCPECGYPINY